MLTTDPGWKPALPFLLPVIGPRIAARSGARIDGLVMLRGVLLSFCVSVGGIGVVVLMLNANEGPEAAAPDLSATTGAAGVAAVGLCGLVLSRIVRPGLDCSSEAKLLGSYRSRLFLRMALAEPAALVGFVAYFLTYDPVPCGIGLTLTAVGFVLLAPSARNLERDQEALNQTGCPHSLVTALRGTERADPDPKPA